MLRGLNLISNNSYTSITFCLKYSLADSLNAMRILALLLCHHHPAGFRNDEYSGRSSSLTKPPLLFRYHLPQFVAQHEEDPPNLMMSARPSNP